MKKIDHTMKYLLIVTAVAFIMCISTIFFVWKADMFKNELQSLQEDLQTVQENLQTTQETLYIAENELVITKEALQIEFQKEDELFVELEELNAELDAANNTIMDLKNDEYELVYTGEFRYTYYCNESYEHICGYGIGLTASGKPTEVGWTVAADTSVLPMGSVIYIEGIGFREVMDVGGGVKGNHIDILLDTHNECFEQTLVNGGVWILVKKS